MSWSCRCFVKKLDVFGAASACPLLKQGLQDARCSDPKCEERSTVKKKHPNCTSYPALRTSYLAIRPSYFVLRYFCTVTYSLSNIQTILQAEWLQKTETDPTVEHLLFDSRSVAAPAVSLFFALPGKNRDGHRFIPELYAQGVRQFVVSQSKLTPRIYRRPMS
jgi:hypothetical protein